MVTAHTEGGLRVAGKDPSARLTVTRHQAYIPTNAIRISRPKANLATSKLLLPLRSVSSARNSPSRVVLSIRGGLKATFARRVMCETRLRGGHGGRSGERRRRVWRCDMRDVESTIRYVVRMKKIPSLRHGSACTPCFADCGLCNARTGLGADVEGVDGRDLLER